MPRYVAMIPARLGSKRIKKKNLRMLGDKPLIAHVIETAVASGEFDAVYVNSEADIFADVAAAYGAKFYKRSEKYSTDDATNDQFALDFMDRIPCDVLVQINPTSPFLSIAEIRKAKALFEKDRCDTVLAVKEARIEGVLKDRPLNFDPHKQMPRSQDLDPLYIFCNGILAWRTDVFRKNMQKYGCAVYGGDGKIGYCIFEGDSTIDIDNNDDFGLAELVLMQRATPMPAPRYWDELHRQKEHSEVIVKDILRKDGVSLVDLEDVNHPVINISELLAKGSKTTSWSKRIINSLSNCVTLISQMPGEGNRLHYHDTWDEWWYILEGEWDYEMDGKVTRVKAGDVVFIARNHRHKVTARGNSRSIRMAVSRDDVAHIYPEDISAKEHEPAPAVG